MTNSKPERNWRAKPCPCGQSSCKDWHVDPVAAVQGVNFTEEEARVAAASFLLLDALKNAKEHLEYCGYGDSWEREGAMAQGLPDKIEEALKAAGEPDGV